MNTLISRLSDAVYRRAVKPILFRGKPDKVHNAMVRTGRFTQGLPLVSTMMRGALAYKNDECLAQDVFGLRFVNPIGLSAGMDKNAEIVTTMRSVGFGFMTAGSITADPTRGNDRPWYYRLPKTRSIVVNAGLANVGADIISKRITAYPDKIFDDFLLIASVAKTNSDKTTTDEAGIADYIECIEKLRNNRHISMFEINISCPNTFGGEPFTRAEPLEALLSKIDALDLSLPVTVKMPISLEWPVFRELLEVIVQHKIQGVTIGNLQKNRADVDLKDPLPDTVPGNLSGAPCFAASNDLISRTFAEYGERLTIIGVGGVFTAKDAYEKIRCGATLVDMITGVIFGGPQMIGRINHDLVSLLERDGYHNISEAIGANHRESSRR